MAVAEVTVPQSVLSVGDRAFAAYNGGLRRITFLGAPTLGAAVFNRYGEAVELHFEGGVPGFDPETFGGTDVVAFYPGDEGGWTPAVRQAYGGQPVWVNGRETPVPTGKRPKSEKLKAEKSGYDVSVMDNGDGTYTRVIPTGKGVAVEIYKRSTGKLIWKKTLKQELPLYGGFFGGERFNFLVFGQTNYDESDRREVVRVVRYTKNWRRVDAAVVKGANTVEPFRAGNVAFAEHGNMLYLHTCHLMYKSSDGRNHQANLDIDVYVPSMQVTADQSQISYFGTGYVSHSFEQYIINDGADVIQLDLGDAYPRAVAMYRVSCSAGSVARSSAYGTGLEVLPIAGAIGDNYTGVSLAGLEATSTCYVTAGVSDSQAGKYPEEPENIFVAAVNKDEFNKAGMTLRWLTHYKKKDKMSLSGPRLVNLSADSLLLLWTEGGEKVRYVFLDGAGNAASPIRSFAGMSTGGKPIVSGGQVNWVYNDGSRLRLASVAVDGALQAPEIKSFANTAKGIKLTWGKVKGAKGYYVYRRTEGKKWSKLATVKGKTSYVDKKAKAGKSYCYIVRAYKGKTLSGYSDIGRPVPRLTAPAKLKAKKASYWTRIDLSWEKVAGAEGYLVYRRVDNGKWTLYGNYYDTSTELYDWDVKSGKKYSYKVRARQGGFTSADSAATNPIKP